MMVVPPSAVPRPAAPVRPAMKQRIDARKPLDWRSVALYSNLLWAGAFLLVAWASSRPQQLAPNTKLDGWSLLG